MRQICAQNLLGTQLMKECFLIENFLVRTKIEINVFSLKKNTAKSWGEGINSSG
jgi:hypothetical protein